MPLITVFTPTYNRADKLKRCYQSLLEQEYIDFEWLIIDDGSTDNTQNVVKWFIDDNKILIRYYYQENSGKQSAWNKAIEIAKGKYFIGVDSDDALVSGALKKLTMMVNLIDSDDTIGLRAISVTPDSFIPNNGYLLNNDKICNWFSEFKSGKHGERIDFLKTDIIKKYKYPVDFGTKFIPEIWFYSSISLEYNFYYSSEKVRLFFDDEKENRLSKSSLKKNARGHLISRASLINNAPIVIWLNRPIDLIKSIVRLNQSYIYASDVDDISLSYLIRLLVFPAKLIRYFWLFK